MYRSPVISKVVSSASAIFLGLSGAALLFASDVLLPRLIPGFPPNGAWLGQLMAGAWLGIAWLNWLQRATTLGGIYGRPLLMTNLIFYFVSALSMLRALLRGQPPLLWIVFVPIAVLAIVYSVLLLRGPFDGPLRSNK
jgi:hypothetical protein